jgi:hypothetical protein
VLELEGLSEAVAPLFPERRFCSAPCVGAEFLEKFESLDAMVNSPAGSQVADLRHTYVELSRIFSTLMH